MPKKPSAKKFVPRGPRPRKPLIRFTAPVTRKSVQVEIDETNLARLDSYLNFVESTVGVRANYSDLLNKIIPVCCNKDRVYSAYIAEQTKLRTQTHTDPVMQPVVSPKPLGTPQPAAPTISEVPPPATPPRQPSTQPPAKPVTPTPSQPTVRPSLRGGSDTTEKEKQMRW